MSFTIEIPDALADRLRAEAEAHGQDLNHYAVAKLEAPVSAGDKEDEDPEDPEVIAIGQKAMDAWNKGDRGRSAEEVFAEMDAKYDPAVIPAVLP